MGAATWQRWLIKALLIISAIVVGCLVVVTVHITFKLGRDTVGLFVPNASAADRKPVVNENAPVPLTDSMGSTLSDARQCIPGDLAKKSVSPCPMRTLPNAQNANFGTSVSIGETHPKQDEASKKETDDANKDAIANAMTAVGTSVAIMSLLLALGTSWFVRELRKLEVAKADFNKLREDAHSFNASQKEKQITQAKLHRQLLEAKGAAVHWAFEVTPNKKNAAGLSAQLGIWLELLLIDDLAVRKEAFQKLVAQSRPSQAVEWPKGDAQYEPLLIYTEACHVYHAQHEKGVANEGDALNLYGLWCRIFNRFEIQLLDREYIKEWMAANPEVPPASMQP